MIPKDCKRLAEVDFPIAVVSGHASAEKGARCGHIPKIHIWPAARPTASSRAMLLGLLLPDPCEALCPEDFKVVARELLPRVQGEPGTGDHALRQALLKFIGDFADWELAANHSYVDVSRGLVRAAHGYEPPVVVDPFAGGGSIPLEALRLGCETFASDLNPVACLILKVVLEDIPRHGPSVADDLRDAANKIKMRLENDLAAFYPKDRDGAAPITYLWARTVRCESPNCGAEIPLVRSFWLCKKANRKWAMNYRVERSSGELPRVEFAVFEPRNERDVPSGTVTRAKATCICCGAVLPPDRVRAQLSAQQGGADVIFGARGRRTGGARMLAVVTLRPGEMGRHYRLPIERDYEPVSSARTRVENILKEWERDGKQGLCPIPDEQTPAGGGSGAGRAFSVQRYGMRQWLNLFTARQAAALSVLARFISEEGMSDDLREFIALAFITSAMK